MLQGAFPRWTPTRSWPDVSEEHLWTPLFLAQGLRHQGVQAVAKACPDRCEPVSRVCLRGRRSEWPRIRLYVEPCVWGIIVEPDGWPPASKAKARDVRRTVRGSDVPPTLRPATSAQCAPVFHLLVHFEKVSCVEWSLREKGIT